jgi:DNA-binding CsgD family transcriptional regulator
MIEALIDQIYEAAIAPEQWPAALDALSDLIDGDGGVLFTNCMQKWVASPGKDDLVAEYVAQGWLARTSRSRRLFEARRAGFLTDFDVFSPDEVEKEPVFTEFLRPRGLGWSVATVITSPSGDFIAIDLERRHSRGPVEKEIVSRLDRLRPHLARAALLSGRLFLQRIQSAAAALDLIGLAAAVLGANGRPLVMNAHCERLTPHLLRERRGRIEIAHAAADALLVEALGRIKDPTSVRSIPVAATAGLPPTILHLIPARGAAHDIFSGAHAILVATPLAPNFESAPAVELVQGLFDLTPAEARVARAIAQRKTIDGIATEFAVSRETIRTQVKSVLAKTGYARQSDLALTLAGAVLKLA